MDVEPVDSDLRIVGDLGAAAVKARNLALLDHPPLFDIEVASACNVVCSFCPRDEMVRTRALMDDATFEAVLRFLPDNAIAMLSGLGDALVHPKLPTFVQRLVDRGIFPCVITNGVRLTAEHQDRLIAAGIAEVQVSVHGLTESTVRKVVPKGANPALVRRHVERLAGLQGPRVRINFVETEDNAHERAAVQEWAASIGARFFHRRQHTRGGTIGNARAETLPGCGIFGSVTFISADGDVLPCVNDVRGEGRFGTVRDATWSEVLAWKREVISRERWFQACRGCDDDYRWVLLARRGLDKA
jgi:MoaA/NifB/PqqE/SkfB family radical SAM enzyme